MAVLAPMPSASEMQGDRGEARTPTQHAQRKAEVTAEIFEESDASRVAAFLLALLHAAKGGGACRARRGGVIPRARAPRARSSRWNCSSSSSSASTRLRRKDRTKAQPRVDS